MLLEFQERIITAEKWWSSVLKGGCVQVIHTLSTEVYISTQWWQIVKTERRVKSMTDLLLMKRDMLHYVQDVRAVRGMGRGLSDHHVVLCKVRLVGAWIKRREVEVGARSIRSEKLREDRHREKYPRSLEGKRVEEDGDNIEHMWE